MLGRDHMHSCPTSKAKALRVWFSPIECRWAERSDRDIARGFLRLSLAQLAGWRLCKVERLGLYLLEGQWAGNWTGGS